MEMEVAREQLRFFRSKSPRLKQMNEVPRSQRGCDRSTEGSSGKVLLPAVCLFRDVLCDDLGSPQILTKFIETPLSTALQFDSVSPFCRRIVMMHRPKCSCERGRLAGNF